MMTAEEKKKQELIYKIMELYRTHAKKYTTILEEYETLLQQRRDLKMTLHKIKESDLRSFKKKPIRLFVECENEEDARNVLSSMSLPKLRAIYLQIEERVEYNSEYRTLLSTVKKYRYDLTNVGKKKRYVQ